MHDALHPRQRPAARPRRVPDVADDQLHSFRQLGDGAAVNLLLERVQHDDLLAAAHQLPCEVAADEARPPGESVFMLSPAIPFV